MEPVLSVASVTSLGVGSQICREAVLEARRTSHPGLFTTKSISIPLQHTQEVWIVLKTKILLP